MNRSILIVICDFLLVSLLAFSTVDINKVADEGTPRTVKTIIATNNLDSGRDLTAVMRLALDEERRNREQLLGELSRARATVADREKQVQATQVSLQAREQEAFRLQSEQTNLQQKLTVAQNNVQTLSQQLQASTTETVLSKEKLAAMEAEARKQREQAAALQQQLAQVAKSNEVVFSEKQQLIGKLQTAEAEKRYAAQQVAHMQEEVIAERAEKAKLAEGVKALASRSDALAQEVRENRALTPNTIFNEFLVNRLQARFNAVHPGLFGDSAKARETETVLASDGTNIYALCHIQDTPLTLANPATAWESLTGTFARTNATQPIRSLSFHLRDPRIVYMPLTAAEAHVLGGKVYRTSSDPYKFQDAVLVGAREGYYGECRFQIDPATPDYVRLDHNFIKGLFGKFNPSRGDLVFSKNNELLGIMANANYCLMLRNFDAQATFQFGKDVRNQQPALTLSLLYGQVVQMPFKLQ